MRAVPTPTQQKISTAEIEVAIAYYFHPRINLIVPRVSWGFKIHECDLLLVTRAGYGYEIEIKISAADLKKDAEKAHHHISNKIKFLFFAIPSYLEPYIPIIPAHTGILMAIKDSCGYIRVKKIRDAQKQGDYGFTLADKFQLARLGLLRYWSLRKKEV